MNEAPADCPSETASTRDQAKSRKPLVLLVLVAGLCLGALFAFSRPSTEPLALQTGIALPDPRPLPEFTLQDHDGRPYTRASLGGRWTLVFAGFTSCPDVCPTTLGILAKLSDRLEGADRDIQVLFLGLDPERDDPATLRSYLGFFDSGFLGATGEKAQIDKLMEALGLAYIRVPTGAQSYTIDHSTALVLIDPRARVAGYFRAPHLPAAIAADLEPVLAAR